MNTQNIMQTSALDLLFANRNKSYGAYQLRKNYNKRLTISVTVMMSICLLFFITYQLQAAKQNTIAPPNLYTEITLIDPVKDKPLAIPPAVKTKPVEKPQAATKFTIPKLVSEPVVAPPTQDDLTNVKIDVQTEDGDHNNVVEPPMEQSIGTGESLIKKESFEGTFTTVQQEARFPGGVEAWKKFLERNLRSTMPAENGAATGTYTVIVSFLVNRDGNISQVKAENDPGFGTAAEAVRVIQRGPAWTPAEQNGHKVTYLQKQSITFVITDQQ